MIDELVSVQHPWALLLMVPVGVGGAAVAAAQAPWRAEVGIQGGFTRVKPTGTGMADQVEMWDAPGGGTTYPTLFLIVPVTKRLAVEPSVSAAQESIGAYANGLMAFGSSSRLGLTLRGNVALAAGLYAAAGGMLRYSESDGVHRSRLGLVAAVGYRAALGGGISARVEAQGVALHRSDQLAPANIYALLLGISKAAAGSAGPSGSRKAAGHWQLALGVAGGYARNHARGTLSGLPVRVDQTLLALPGSSAAIPPTLYAIIPVRGPLALELGFDSHRTATSDSVSLAAQLAPRLDVALPGRWYAAAGGNLRYSDRTGTKGIAFAGANVAAGYRFPLTESLDGRVELSYSAFKERDDAPLAQNIVAVMVGVTMALR